MSNFDLLKFPVFKMRPDLPEEIGYLDFLRKPVSFEAFSARKMKVSPMSPGAMELAYEENCRCRSMLPLQRFYGIMSHQAAESPVLLNEFTDGILPMRVAIDGLFRECMVRANIALGRSPDGPYAIVPNKHYQAGKANHATHFVVFDGRKGRAFVLPHEELKNINWRMYLED